MRRPVALRPRAGFSMVEALVALVLLSVSLVALAPILFQAVSRQRTEAVRLERTGALLGETNRLLALPFPALDAEAACQTFAGPRPFAHERCVTVAGTGVRRQITVVVTPADGLVPPDSIQFTRTTGSPGNLFNTSQ